MTLDATTPSLATTTVKQQQYQHQSTAPSVWLNCFYLAVDSTLPSTYLQHKQAIQITLSPTHKPPLNETTSHISYLTPIHTLNVTHSTRNSFSNIRVEWHIFIPYETRTYPFWMTHTHILLVVSSSQQHHLHNTLATHSLTSTTSLPSRCYPPSSNTNNTSSYACIPALFSTNIYIFF